VKRGNRGKRENDQRDLGQLLADYTRRHFQAKTDVERKRLQRELDRHIARPELIVKQELTRDVEILAREFEIRLKKASSPPPNLIPAYREAFRPFFERMGALPPPGQWEWFAFDLWTHYMTRFYFVYGAEPLRELLAREAFRLIAPSIEYFEKATAAADDVERARRTRAFVEAVEADVDLIVEEALRRFAVALGYRLGAVLNETLDEVALAALDEMKGQLRTIGERLAAESRDRVAEIRDHILKERMRVEKVRLGTPAPGAPTLTKEEFEALIDEAQAALRPLNMSTTRTAVVAYLNNNYPAVRCGGVKQLKRLLDKFGLEHKFPVENRGQNSE
jgi:hypothetical protein